MTIQATFAPGKCGAMKKLFALDAVAAALRYGATRAWYYSHGNERLFRHVTNPRCPGSP